MMKEIIITAEGTEIIEGLLAQSPSIVREEWKTRILRMITLLMCERGVSEANKDLVIEAAKFVSSPDYLPFFDVFDNRDSYKTTMADWYFDNAAYYAANRAVKRWKSTVTKPNKTTAEMKVLAINSSPRKSGNTQMLINHAVESMQNSGVLDIEHLFLHGMNIGYCLGCRKCKDPGYKKTCVIDDDMTEIYDKIINSDVFIVGLPIFSAREPAQLITFLNRLDSFRRFDEAKDGIVPTRLLEPGIRRAMVIGTWGYPNTEIYDHVIAHVATVLYMQRIEPMEIISACGFGGKFHGYDENKKAIILRYPNELQKVYEAGKALVTGIIN